MVGAKMTANELADELAFKHIAGDDSGAFSSKIITMLRQQQAEIEALKKDNKELHAIAQRMAMAESDARKSLQWFKDAKEMNNEPVAWAVWEGSVHNMFFTKEEADELCRLKGGDAKSVPLYTHPVKEQDTECQYCKQGCIRCDARKQLTDEEILSLTGFKDNPYDIFIEYEKEDLIEFARAILRKAQEADKIKSLGTVNIGGVHYRNGKEVK